MILGYKDKTPVIHESVFIAGGAYVFGDVEIGEGSGIFPGAVIRADFGSIRIGRNTMIEDNSVLHSGIPLEVGDNVTIGHGVVMHGLSIGDNTLIGNNATVLDNAQVGNFCIIGAGCLVSQGMVIPDYSFVVGIPAEIKRQISPEQRQRRVPGPARNLTYAKLVELYKEQGL